MHYPIPIEEINSSSIRRVAQWVGATHVRVIGSANTDPTEDARPDWDIVLYELNDSARTRVIGTNADCITEHEDGFAELAALCEE